MVLIQIRHEESLVNGYNRFLIKTEIIFLFINGFA